MADTTELPTVHEIKLSDDAFYLAAMIQGMWLGAEVLDNQEIYTRFFLGLRSRFGDYSSSRFTTALNELSEQFQPRR